MSQETEPYNQSGGWLITFADLLSLLLTFFVLMFSMSTVEIEEWRTVVDTMSRQFNKERPLTEITPQQSQSQNTETNSAGLNLNYLRVLMERSVASHASFDGVSVYRSGDKVVISFPVERLFQPRDTTLATGAEQPIRQLAGTLAQIRNSLRVESNSGVSLLVGEKYRSHWELAMARGAVVAAILTEYGYTRPVLVVSRAESQRVTESTVRRLAGGSTVDIVISADETRDHIYDMH